MIKLDANKIMKGSPPPLEYQVTLENWRKYPYNICINFRHFSIFDKLKGIFKYKYKKWKKNFKLFN